MKIGLLYNGNKEYIDQLLEYDITFLIDNEKYVDELLEYNKRIVVDKYNKDNYDVLISYENDFKGIRGRKKIVIGNYEEHKHKVKYMDKLSIEEIFKKDEKEDIKFSIIIPNYNNAKWIDKTIESILNQTYDKWEVYIIDDMSTDNSIEVINQYKDKRIILIQNEIKLYNGGSRNIGILKAKKSNPDGYLLFIDSDDWLANNDVLKDLNAFIDDEDLITLDYQLFANNELKMVGKQTWKNKNDLFMTVGSFCAVWCKCFKVEIAPLFEFNTLMEDRNYHYRVVNRANTYINYDNVTHIWNRMNKTSITTDKRQKYEGDLQCKIEWNNCAYRHIAGMLDLLNELDDPVYISFIEDKIRRCKDKVNSNVFEQF